MNKILNLKKSLEDLGVKTTLNVNVECYCSDGKIHKAIELSTNISTEEDNLCFVFHPTTHKLVDNYLQCPTVKK